MTVPPPDLVVSDQPDRARFEITVNGRHAGAAYYRLMPRSIVFTHTEVDPQFEGQGIGSALARAALDDVRERGGLQVVPLCPFFASFIRRHQEYIDLVDEDHRDKLRSASG